MKRVGGKAYRGSRIPIVAADRMRVKPEDMKKGAGLVMSQNESGPLDLPIRPSGQRPPMPSSFSSPSAW